MTELSKSIKTIFLVFFLMMAGMGWSQQSNTSYKRRVLEASEVDLLFSYYNQDGQNAAVTGGEGTEELTDATSSIVLRMPMNEDDILTVDVGLSAYTSASSSNVNPLDGGVDVSPFDASSGESRRDVLAYINPTYEHSFPMTAIPFGASMAIFHPSTIMFRLDLVGVLPNCSMKRIRKSP